MPGDHCGQQCKKKGLTPIFVRNDDTRDAIIARLAKTACDRAQSLGR